jgi:competence protein ComEC
MLALADRRHRIALLGVALLAAGWWLASTRLHVLDQTRLRQFAGQAIIAELEIDGPGRRGQFAWRVPVRVRSVWRKPLRERAVLELPGDGPAPPQGAIVDAVATVREPRPADDGTGFDERAYLARQGVHVVLRADRYQVVGHRAGLRGFADRIRERLARGIAPGLAGERGALVAGLVLGEDGGLDDNLRQDFRNSGLYHLLAVSGQNVAYVAGAALLVAWLAGLPRWLGEIAALGATAAYVLAVGWQPSVVRAGVAGALASLAWLAARPRDRWYFALVGAATLLAWNPYSLLDPGFQLSFAAVAAIFVLAPRIDRLLRGYPVPRRLATVVAIATACGLVTAPILWLQFGSVPLLTVAANAIAEPVIAPILGLGLGAAVIGTVSHDAAAALAWVNGWLAEYLAWCARAVGSLPFARVTSGWVVAALLGAGVLGVGLWRAPPWWKRPLLEASVIVAGATVAWRLLR